MTPPWRTEEGMMSFLNPTGCRCVCHDSEGDSEGGCELCNDIHVADDEGDADEITDTTGEAGRSEDGNA